MACETEERLTVVQAYEELARERALVEEWTNQLKEGAKITEKEIRLVRDSLEKIVRLVEWLKGYDPLTEIEEGFARLAEPYIRDPERRNAFAADIRRYVEEKVRKTGDFGS